MAPVASEKQVGVPSGPLALVRPLNLLVVGIGVLVGAVLAGDVARLGGSWEALSASAIAAAMIAAGANAFNDYVDVDADSVNRPLRPIPSGRVSRSAAVWVWVGCSLLGLLLAWYVGSQHLLLAGTMVLLLVAYSLWLQHVPLVGNVVVGLGVAATLVFGGLVFGVTEPVVVGGAFAFLTTLARELVKDVEDLAGDAEVGSKALPSAIGTRPTIALSLGVVLVSVALVPAPYLFLGFSGLYLMIGLLAAAALAVSAWCLIGWGQRSGAHHITRASSMLKLSMILGLFALIVARAPA